MKSRDLMELALSFQKNRILLTACELDIFTAVGKTARSSAEVALALGAAARYTDRLMNALCGLGLLKKSGARFRNTPISLKYLVNGSPHFMKSMMHTVHMWKTWSSLTDTVRYGRPAAKEGINDRGEGWIAPFIAAMHERASKSAPSIVGLLDLSGVGRVLDVGGGSGAYAMAFAKARKGITSTVFDLPNVLPLTRKYIEKEGLSNRVDLAKGDYNKDAFGSSYTCAGGAACRAFQRNAQTYDIVFISAVIHINSPEQNMALIRKAASALNDNGQIVIQDFIMDEDRVNPPSGAVFALNMLVATESGDTYTGSEVKGWLKDAGFIDVRRLDTKFGTTLVIGRKRTGKRCATPRKRHDLRRRSIRLPLL